MFGLELHSGMPYTHSEKMPSLREWNAVSNALSDIVYCRVVEREHPELRARMIQVLNLLEEMWYPDEFDGSTLGEESDHTLEESHT